MSFHSRAPRLLNPALTTSAHNTRMSGDEPLTDRDIRAAGGDTFKYPAEKRNRFRWSKPLPLHQRTRWKISTAFRCGGFTGVLDAVKNRFPGRLVPLVQAPSPLPRNTTENLYSLFGAVGSRVLDAVKNHFPETREDAFGLAFPFDGRVRPAVTT